jgi:hypothetical protein
MSAAGRWLAPLAVLAAALPAPALGQAALDVGGFVQASYAVRLGATECGDTRGCELMLGEQRLQARLEAYSSAGELEGELTGRVDVIHDTVLGRSAIEPLELYVEVKVGAAMARLGRQIVTWGSGDLLFVNDVFPKDWESFFLGRSPEYLRVGFDALRVTVPHLELVVAPRPGLDRTPRSERFILPSSPWPDVPILEPRGAWRLEDLEAALRVSAAFSGWELSLYASWVHHRGGVLVPDDPEEPMWVELRSPRVVTTGASVTGRVAGGIWNLEGGYQHAREDVAGDDPFVPNSAVEVFTGWARPLWSDATAGAQASLRAMLQHDRYRAALPPGQPGQPELDWTFTLRLTQQLLRQTLELGAFVVASPSRRDAFAALTARYRLTDALAVDAGASLFAGSRPSSLFGGLVDNSNVHVSLRYGF